LPPVNNLPENLMIKVDMKTIMLCLWIFAASLLMQGQVIKGLRSDNTGQYPILEWYSSVVPDTTACRVYRGSVDKEDFVRILPQYFIKADADTTFYYIFDTTLTKPGVYRYYIDVPGKRDTTHSEILFGQTPGFLKTPYVESFTAEPVEGKKAIRLQWKLSDTRTVQGLALFRSRNYHDGYELIARLAPDAELYEDRVERSNEPWFYFLQIRDFFGYQPPSIRIHGFSTYASPPLPPQEMSAYVGNNKVTLRFRSVGEDVIGFNIYRREGDKSRYLMVARQDVHSGEWYELKDTVPFAPQVRELFYYATAVSDGYLESNSGDTVVVDLAGSMEVVPPAGLSVLTDDQGYPTLFWDPMENNPAVAGFNVFRTADQGRNAEIQKPVKLNPTLIHFSQNYWTDSTRGLEGGFLYEVESVNQTGQPSLLRSGVRIDVVPTVPVLILAARQDETGIILSWQGLSDKEITKLHIYRTKGDGVPELAASKPNMTDQWTDTKTTVGNSYSYYVEAECKNGKRLLVNPGILVKRE
jgi:hypothetical protein